MMRYIFICLLFVAVSAYSQCKTYRLGSKGDTLNCTDKNDLKQGMWLTQIPGLRGEPGYEEEGAYKDNKKEGIWKRYSLEGDPVSVESYRWGNKNGTSRYFTLAGLVREENWKAVNPENPYDTVEVPDLNDSYKVEMKVVKIEGTAVKHGTWTYYNPVAGTVLKTETYFLDKLQDPNKKAVASAQSTDSTSTAKKDDKNKPREVLEYEKKNSGKKKIKVRSGATGIN